MGYFGFNNSEKGQILLIVVLAAVVSLTVGLSAVSRTITNTNVTTEEANSQKALSAAEAGVEQLLKQDNPGVIADNNITNNSAFTAKAREIKDSNFALNGGGDVLKDDGVDIWLSTYPDFGDPRWGGILTLYWQGNNNCAITGSGVNPAIEVVVLSGTDKNNPVMSRYAYDTCAASATRNNGFEAVVDSTSTVNIDGIDFNRRKAFPAISNGFIVRVIPLYGNTKIAVTANPGSLPVQGYVIESIGSSGNTKRSVSVFKGFPRIPIEYFPYNIFQP